MTTDAHAASDAAGDGHGALQGETSDRFSPTQAVAAPYYLGRAALLALLIVAWATAMRAIPKWASVENWGALLAALLLALGIARRALIIASTRYTIDAQRITIKRGLIGKQVRSLELFRVQDVNFDQRWWQALLGFGSLRIMSSGSYHPLVLLEGIRDGLARRERLTRIATAARRQQGVREVTVGQ